MNQKIEKILTLIVLFFCVSFMECKEGVMSEIESPKSQEAFIEKLNMIKSIKKDIENQYTLLNEIVNSINLDHILPDFKNEILNNKANFGSMDSSSEFNGHSNEKPNSMGLMKRFDWYKRNMMSSRYSKIPVIRTG
ncbi:unnamed protein product [Brachionus calyciflorus]|uniref:Uncharacterized protein n=1 Tax=Brachionus calyciflorus TaxID=104777 RepID=A0A813U222_9BILA|nr:unnamed protein product [Brachionus calyciflorus]